MNLPWLNKVFTYYTNAIGFGLSVRKATFEALSLQSRTGRLQLFRVKVTKLSYRVTKLS
jgi:hypothetical protein